MLPPPWSLWIVPMTAHHLPPLMPSPCVWTTPLLSLSLKLEDSPTVRGRGSPSLYASYHVITEWYSGTKPTSKTTKLEPQVYKQENQGGGRVSIAWPGSSALWETSPNSIVPGSYTHITCLYQPSSTPKRKYWSKTCFVQKKRKSICVRIKCKSTLERKLKNLLIQFVSRFILNAFVFILDESLKCEILNNVSSLVFLQWFPRHRNEHSRSQWGKDNSDSYTRPVFSCCGFLLLLCRSLHPGFCCCVSALTSIIALRHLNETNFINSQTWRSAHSGQVICTS